MNFIYTQTQYNNLYTEQIFRSVTWAAEVIWYKTQLTGCSYLVLQFRDVFWGLTSFSNATLVFKS